MAAAADVHVGGGGCLHANGALKGLAESNAHLDVLVFEMGRDRRLTEHLRTESCKACVHGHGLRLHTLYFFIVVRPANSCLALEGTHLRWGKSFGHFVVSCCVEGWKKENDKCKTEPLPSD